MGNCDVTCNCQDGINNYFQTDFSSPNNSLSFGSFNFALPYTTNIFKKKVKAVKKIKKIFWFWLLVGDTFGQMPSIEHTSKHIIQRTKAILQYGKGARRDEGLKAKGREVYKRSGSKNKGILTQFG